MKTLAIIAEYNPFHNGHQYHLECAKKLTGADYSIALMSGNFLQRGIPAMWDKYTRATMASLSGVDLTLELPFVYASGSARDFATGAVSILDSLGIVDYLCFGAETDNLDLLSIIADVINSEPDSYKEQLNYSISNGLSFPQARTVAVTKYLSQSKEVLKLIQTSEHQENLEESVMTTLQLTLEGVASALNMPNNILAIEYIAALRRINSRIKPVIIKRCNAMYHDEKLYNSISSATAIRASIEASSFELSNIKHDIPAEVYNVVESSYMHSWPINYEALTPYLQCKLLNPCIYNEICDISEEFAHKLRKLQPVTNYQAAIDALSSKDLTATRIFRNLIHLIMDYKEEHRKLFIDNSYAMYASILSFRKDKSALLKHINEHSSIPLITKKADFEKYFADHQNINLSTAKIMWDYDIKATNLYNCLVYNTYGSKLQNDYNISLPII